MPLLLLCACGPALTALDPGVDAARLERQVERAEPTPEMYLQTVWLCLLHGRRCEKLPGTPPNSADLTQLFAAALASDGLLEIPPRLRAWLHLAEAAQRALPQERADRLLTLAADALAHLAERDPALVAAQLQTVDVRQWLQSGAPLERWHRRQALARFAAPNQELLEPLELEFQLLQAPQPVSRRLFTGLNQLDALPQKPFAGLEIPLLPTQAALASDLRTHRYALPAKDPGIYRLQARLEVKTPEKRLLHVETARPLRAWLDGQPLGTLGPETLPLLVDLPAGPHTLDLAVPLGQNGQLLALALLKPDTQQKTQPWPQVLDDLLEVQRRPEGPAASQLERQFPHALAPMEALLRRADLRDVDNLPPTQTVDALLSHWPTHADAQLTRAMQTREAGQAQLGAQALEGLMPPPVEGQEVLRQRVDVQLERARTWLALGLADLAGQEAETAAQTQPHDCRTWSHALTVAQDAADRALVRRLLTEAPQCPGQHLQRALAQAMVGQLEGALQSLHSVAQEPWRAREVQNLTRLLQQALAKGPQPPRPPPSAWVQDPAEQAWREAQTAALHHDQKAQQASLHTLLTAPGLPLEARQKAIQAGVKPVWQPFTLNGEQLAQAPLDEQFAEGAATVWLLDQEIVQLLPEGGAIRRVHQVVRVREDAAADAVGEIRVGDGADLELARTILEDGTIVLPAETTDKETISLRAVSAGTTVEFAQVAYMAADDPATGATRLPLFEMHSTMAPVLNAQYVVLVPDGLEVKFDASPMAGTEKIQQVQGFTAHIYTRTNLPRLRSEPRAARADLVLPTVRVLARPSLEAVLAPWNEALAAYVQSADPLLRTWKSAVAQVPEGLPRWQKLAARLALTVQHVQEGGLPGRPETALSQNRGDRAAVFYTLAKQLGANVCLVRVLPLARLRTPPLEPPDPEDFGLEIVRLRQADGTEVWYDPGLDGGPLNHLRAGLRGREGLLAGCDAPDPHVQIPPLGEGLDGREIELTLHWQKDGALQGLVHEKLRGVTANSVRSYLRGNGANERDLVEQLAGGVFGSADMHLLTIVGLSGEGPIELAWDVTLAADHARADALELDLWSEHLGQTYATLPTRTTPLLFSHALEQTVTVHVQSDEPLQVVTGVVEVRLPLLNYTRKLELLEGELSVQKHMTAHPGLVTVQQYAEFARTLLQVDAADRVRIRRLP